MRKHPPALTTNHPRVNEGKSMATANPTVQYRDIPGFPGYRVGDDGSVWTCFNRGGIKGCIGNRRAITATWRRLKPQLRKRDGRYQVGLYSDSRYKMIHVHTLVLTAFVGPRPDGMECCHGDGDKTNDTLANLRWDTHTSNVQDMIRHGTRRSVRGEEHGNSRLTDKDIRAIRSAHATGTIGYKRLAQIYGIDYGSIARIVKRRSWKHVV